MCKSPCLVNYPKCKYIKTSNGIHFVIVFYSYSRVDKHIQYINININVI